MLEIVDAIPSPAAEQSKRRARKPKPEIDDVALTIEVSQD